MTLVLVGFYRNNLIASTVLYVTESVTGLSMDVLETQREVREYVTCETINKPIVDERQAVQYCNNQRRPAFVGNSKRLALSFGSSNGNSAWWLCMRCGLSLQLGKAQLALLRTVRL